MLAWEYPRTAGQMKAIYRGAFSDKPGRVLGQEESDLYPMEVGEVYDVSIEGDFYDVRTLDGERIHGWCGSTSLDGAGRDWFFVQEPFVGGVE